MSCTLLKVKYEVYAFWEHVCLHSNLILLLVPIEVTVRLVCIHANGNCGHASFLNELLYCLMRCFIWTNSLYKLSLLNTLQNLRMNNKLYYKSCKYNIWLQTAIFYLLCKQLKKTAPSQFIQKRKLKVLIERI